MVKMDNTFLPEDPCEIFETIKIDEDPWKMALVYGRELMRLTEPEKKNFWYKAELNLLVLILLCTAKGSDDIRQFNGKRLTDAEHAAWLIHEPEYLKEYVKSEISLGMEKECLLRPNFMAWQTSTHGVSDNVAANLAVESEITEYLLGKYSSGTDKQK